MKRRLPEISDWATLGRAERMLRAHARYRKVGQSRPIVAATIKTAVEVTVIQLTACLPETSRRRDVPKVSSGAYRQVIRETTRSASGGRISRKQKKRLRNAAYETLVSALDFLDT